MRYRYGSGGDGEFRGGDGLMREMELLADCEVTLLADRRRFAPYGLSGGQAGESGRAMLTEPQSDRPRDLPGKCSLGARAGSILRIETPGGGGWGSRER